MSKKRILYLEDDETLGFLTADFLEIHYAVSHFTSGKEAFEAFTHEDFDLCILDVMVPDMDGFEVAAAIRKKNQEVPIIFLSAKTMKEDRIKGLKLGADDYLVKPFSMEELQLKMEVFLNRSQKNIPINNNMYIFGPFIFDPSNYCVTENKEVTQLTERESSLLKFLLDHKNTVLKREKILTELWGNDDYFMGRSMDVFISRLRKIFKNHPNIRIDNIPRIGFKMVVE